MFGISWSELLIIAVIALLCIGPKELPTVMYKCGQWIGSIKRMANNLQGQFDEVVREVEVEKFTQAANRLGMSLDVDGKPYIVDEDNKKEDAA